MAMQGWFAAMAVVVASVAAAPPAAADLIAPGTKFVRNQAVIDAGRFDDYCEHSRLIREGDTLEKIAREVYGDPTRVADLLRCNEGLVPEKLKVGATLVLAPKKAPIAGSSEAIGWHFYVGSGYDTLAEADRVFPGVEFRAPRRGYYVVAVDAAHAADFAHLRETDGKQRQPEGWAAALPWLCLTPSVRTHDAIEASSAAETITTTLELREVDASAKGAKRWQVVAGKQERFDEKGKPVVGGWLGGDAGGGPGAARAVALLALSLIGAVGLLALRRRAPAVA